jgi:hypothetical protein
VAQLVGKENAPLTYGLSAGVVGESLGLDALTELESTAQKLGKTPPAEQLSVSEIVDAVVLAYLRGKDSPPPAVRSNAVYEIMTTNVVVPKPSEGWLLLRCTRSDVTFVRPSQSEQSTATVRIASIQQDRSDGEFLSNIKAFVEASAPQGALVQPWVPKLAKLGQRRCAEIETVFRSADRVVTYVGRICNGANGSPLGHAVIFAHNSLTESHFPRADAMSFITSNLPR